MCFRVFFLTGALISFMKRKVIFFFEKKKKTADGQSAPRLYDEGDVAMLASEQNQCWSVSQVTFTTRMS